MLKNLILAVFSLFLFSACTSQDPTPKTKPNVIIFLTDDQGTLDLGCYGAKDLKTPEIDKLAESGIRFTQAYSHIVCCPARALLVTGRHPQRSGIVHWTQGNPNQKETINLPVSEYTIAEALKDNGYKTALFGKWHIGAKNGHGPTYQGFDRFFGHLGGFIENYRHFFMHGYGFHDLYDQRQEIFKKGSYFPEMMTQKAVEYVEENKDNPFFMFVSYNIPHYPEQPDPKFAKAFNDLSSPRKEYARMIATVDDYTGRIIDKLEEMKLRENTIILFYSDNGHSTENASVRFDNHKSGFPKGYYYGANKGGGYTGKWLGNKGDYREGGIRVPAILSYPAGLEKGIVRDQAVIGADWYPTILELCGIPLPEVKLDGRSVLPLIKDAKAESPHKVMYWGWRTNGAVRKGDWKLLVVKDKGQTLYNLADDEPEKVNYIKEKPEIGKELLELYLEWKKETAVE